MAREKSASSLATLAQAGKKAFVRIDALNEQAWDLNRKDPKKAIETAEEALALSRKNNYRKGIAYALRTIGACCIWLSKNEEAMAHCVEAIELLKEIGDKKEEAQVNYNIGTNFYYMADYENALKYYMQCYRINEETQNLMGMADARNGMGAVYYTTGQNDKAIENLEKALAMSEEVGDTLIRPKILDGLGECYLNLKKYDKAIEYMFNSLEFTRMRSGTEQVQGFALNGIGRIYAVKGDLEKALLYYSESLSIRRKIGHKIGEVTTLTNMGRIYFRQKKNKNAIAALQKALNLATRIKYNEGISQAAEALAKIYEKTGKTKKAFELYKKFHQAKEEVLKEKDSKKTRSHELQFKMEQMEKERMLLRQKNRDLESFYKDVTLLSEIGQKIISSLSVEVIVETVYENVNAMMSAEGFGIGLLADEGKSVVFPVYIEEGERLNMVCYDTSDKNRLTIWCIDNKREIFINDFENEVNRYINYVQPPVAGRSVESLLYLPLMVKEKLLGVITVQSFSKNAYTPYHLNMLRNLAMYAAIALENASLYAGMEEEVKKRTHEAVAQKEQIERAYKNTQLLAEIGQQITSTLNFDTIFTKLYENVNRLMDAECFGVRIYHEGQNAVEYKFEIENGQKYEPVMVSMTDDDNYTVWCIKNRKEIFLNDNVNEYKKYVKQIRVVSGEMPHSLLFSPMMLGERLVGVITVQSFKKHAYSPYHLDILRTLGTYTAIALDNANLYEHMEEKVRQRTTEVVKQKEEIEKTYLNTRLMSQIGKDITATLSVNDIIDKVYANVNSLMDATTFGIGIYRPERGEIVFPATIEKGRKLSQYSYSLADTHRPAMRCYINQEDFFINNFADYVRSNREKDYAAQVGELPESMIYVPVTSNDKKIGVITVQSFKTNAYTDYHLQVLKNLAVYVAIAIDNASLYQDMEQRVKERTAEIEKNYLDTHLLSRIAKDISASLNVETIISKVYQNVNELMDATCFGIGILNPAQKTIDFPGFVERGNILQDVSFSTHDVNRLAVWCFRNEEEIFINDYSAEYIRYIKTAKAPIAGQDASSIIYLPIFSKEKVIGVITVQSFEKNAYTSYHLDMLKSLAVSVGIALENASLYQNLEAKVRERTAEVIQQKEIIEQKNKEITDSINYSKQIQRAILPHTAEIYRLLPDSFGYYKPKDVVSGDFYWVGQQDGKVLVAAADCTGHGVPGAFMSMLGSNKLDYAVYEKKMTRPCDILALVNKGIKSTLKQNVDGSLSRDGMDIGLCCIDFENSKIEFAGANRPLLHIRNGMLCEVPPTKSALGGLTPDEQEFQHEEIEIRKGDCIYIFTDGYADQFGGEQGKKFMTKRFKEMLLSIHDKSMKEQETFLENTLEEWKSGREQVDDILVIGIRI